MFKLALFTSFIAVVVSFSITEKELDHTWELWKHQFFKNYSKDVEMFRRRIWEDNMQLVTKHNAEYSLGLHTYTLGMNEYADMTTKEFVTVMTGFREDALNEQKGQTFAEKSGTHSPERIDWRDHGYVTKVKDQGQCGSCWAFSTTGSLEGQHYRKTGRLVSLSEQNLVDCSKRDHGCSGGWMVRAFQYVIDNGGIDNELTYPYEEQQRTCRFNPYNVGATMYSYVEIPQGSEIALEHAVGEVGPISVAIDSSLQTFHLYKSGIYFDQRCKSSHLNHAVLVVGYDKDPNGVEYWIVKNSWGTSWGQEGYIWMSKNKGNQCGIASNASYPLV